MDHKTKKKLGKLKTTYRNKAKNNDVKIRIATNLDEIEVYKKTDHIRSFQDESYTVRLRYVLGILKVGSLYSRNRGYVQEKNSIAINLIKGFIADYLPLIGAKGFVVHQSLNWEKATPILDYHEGERDSLRALLNEANLKDYSLLKLEGFEDAIAMSDHYHSLYSTKQKEEPIFTYSGAPTSNEVWDHQIYYHGYNGNIQFNYQAGRYTLKEALSGEMEIETEDDLTDAFQSIMKKIYDKKRLLNLASPPRYHFNKAFNFSNALKDKIYSHLTHITPTVIEERMAAEYKKVPIISERFSYSHHISLFELFGKYFVVNKDTLYVYDSFEEGEEKFYAEYRKDFERENVHAFNKIKEKGKKKIS